MKRFVASAASLLTVAGALLPAAISETPVAAAGAPVAAAETPVAAAGALASAAGPVARPDPGGSCGRKCRLRSAARVVTMERVYGSNYRIYKAHYPYALNWGNNGCSVPFSVPIVDHYKNLFQKSCDRHDFGYRNHGRSGYSRSSVDSRFLSNMNYQCLVVYDDWYDVPARGLCYSAADKFYDAIRLFGGGFW